MRRVRWRKQSKWGTKRWRWANITCGWWQKGSSDTGTRTRVSCVKGKCDNHLHYTGWLKFTESSIYNRSLLFLPRTHHLSITYHTSYSILNNLCSTYFNLKFDPLAASDTSTVYFHTISRTSQRHQLQHNPYMSTLMTHRHSYFFAIGLDFILFPKIISNRRLLCRI